MIAYDTDVLVELLKGHPAYAAKARALERAYELYEQTFVALRSMPLLPYTRIAEAQFQVWRQLKVRGSTHDLRIAAISIASSAKLITRNRRDFEQIPGLIVEIWE
ncbi:MAG: hypothetical protein NTY19_35820 [Planctomycetota bacterium]|nr:hypothetical protein [Planctomycetota bacterium]